MKIFRRNFAKIVLGLTIFALSPQLSAKSEVFSESEKEIVKKFEDLHGFKSVFWCANILPQIHGHLSTSGQAGDIIPAALFDAIDYCRVRHFPTGSERECDQSVDSIVYLDQIFDGFSRNDLAIAIFDECKIFVQ